VIDQSRIQELLDKEDIRDLLLRCARGMDRSDWELVLSCYHDDAVDDHGAYRGGARDYVDWLSKALPGWAEWVRDDAVEFLWDAFHERLHLGRSRPVGPDLLRAPLTAPAQAIRTSVLPIISPASMPTSASGACSSPSTTDSR
jgi:SnoaL-like domain